MGEVLDMVPVKQQDSAAIAKTESVFMPVMSMDVALARRETIVEFTKRIMVPDQDFGVIPGTNKPSLLKPGAEKLCCFFGLEPEFLPIVEDVDWTGDQHKGETFYYVRYRCRLLRDGRVLGVGEGSCNSWESKYRWRDGKRKCPKCGAETIFKSKQDSGWFCWAKKGGCAATFTEKDPAIVGQQIGRVPNPDVADVVNTIQKMAQKRALVAATLIATSASEFFTQDAEDMPPREPIDTGGHAVGTQAAADYVRDQKLAQQRESGASSASVGNDAKLNQPTTEIPPEVEEMWKRMGSDPAKIAVELAALYDDLLSLCGNDAGQREYDAICDKFAGRGVDPTKKTVFANRVALELYRRAQELKKQELARAEAAKQPPDGELFAREAAYAD